MYGTGFIIPVVDYCVLFSSVRNDKTRYCIKFELFWWNENDSLQSCRGCGISSDIVTSNQSILGRDNNTLFVALTSVFIPILLCTLKNGYLIRTLLEMKGIKNSTVGLHFSFIKNKMCFDTIHNLVIETFLYLPKIIEPFSWSILAGLFKRTHWNFVKKIIFYTTVIFLDLFHTYVYYIIWGWRPCLCWRLLL